MVGCNCICYLLEQHSLTCLWLCNYQTTLSLAYWCEQINNSCRKVCVSLACDVELFGREQRRKMVERNPVANKHRVESVDFYNLCQREILLAFLRRTDSTFNGIAGLKTEKLYLRLRNVHIIGRIQVVIVRRTQESIVFGHNLQHAGHRHYIGKIVVDKRSIVVDCRSRFRSERQFARLLLFGTHLRFPEILLLPVIIVIFKTCGIIVLHSLLRNCNLFFFNVYSGRFSHHRSGIYHWSLVFLIVEYQLCCSTGLVKMGCHYWSLYSCPAMAFALCRSVIVNRFHYVCFVRHLIVVIFCFHLWLRQHLVNFSRATTTAISLQRSHNIGNANQQVIIIVVIINTEIWVFRILYPSYQILFSKSFYSLDTQALCIFSQLGQQHVIQL